MAAMSEDYAARILQTAIDERQAANLLECLFDGGSVTVDVSTGKLVLATADMLKQMGDG